MLISSGSNSFVDTLLNSDEFEKTLIEAAAATYVISGSGLGIFKSKLTNTFVTVKRGITIQPIEDLSGDYTYCYLGQDILVIPTKQIIDYGWN